MRQLLPSSAIINDLLTENWELRWRVFEIFNQIQLDLRNYARSSREYKEAVSLCLEMANRLNGPSDINLHLILMAAWLLGNSHFLLLVLEKIGVDDPEINDPETVRLKKPLLNNQPQASLFAYFASLLQRGKAVDATTACAVKIFPADLALRLLSVITDPAPRRDGLNQLKHLYPQLFFNQQLLGDPSRLVRQTEFFDFIGPPTDNAERERLCALLEKTLSSRDKDQEEDIIRLIGRLRLDEFQPQLLARLNDNPAVATALAELGVRGGLSTTSEKRQILATEKKRGSTLPPGRLSGCKNRCTLARSRSARRPRRATAGPDRPG